MDEGELLEDYKPILAHVENFQPALKENSHESYHVMISIEDSISMEDGSSLVSQEDKAMESQTLTQAKDPTLRLVKKGGGACSK